MNIFLREADYSDSNMFFTWVNKQDSLDVKIQNKSKIDLKNHDKWFLERLSDSNTYIWVIEDCNKVPLGQIRFQKKCIPKKIIWQTSILKSIFKFFFNYF